MKRLLFSAVVCVMVSIFRGGASAEETPFRPLFSADGAPQGFVVRDWADVSKPAQGSPAWTVRDGVLIGAGDRGSWLLSEREYSDFELEYEFRLGPQGNSGLALRAPLKGDPAFDGMELQMADVRYNPEAKDSELTGGIYRAIAPVKQVYRPEEWNSMRVSLTGSRLKVALNGLVIQDIDLSEQAAEVLRHDGTKAPPVKDRPTKGHIGFQNLSRGDGKVEIRNARIRELKAAD